MCVCVHAHTHMYPTLQVSGVTELPESQVKNKSLAEQGRIAQRGEGTSEKSHRGTRTKSKAQTAGLSPLLNCLSRSARSESAAHRKTTVSGGTPGMSQEPGRLQTPSGPVTEAPGLRLASSQAASAVEGKREAGVAGRSAHVYLWASLLAPQTQAYGRGSRWAGQFLLRVNRPPHTPALACPRGGPGSSLLPASHTANSYPLMLS